MDWNTLKNQRPAGGWKTRFAPSPTGYLHLGHVLHALVVWATAKRLDAKVVLRMEDHDQTRSKSIFESAIIEDLRWMGFVPDLGLDSAGRLTPEFRQSDHLDWFQTTLDALAGRELIYPCRCSRKDIESSVARSPGQEIRYPGTCKSRKGNRGEREALRVHLPDEQVTFQDGIAGEQTQYPLEQCGDFTVVDRDGQFTYQFAVVVDDLHHGINLIVRGEDLLPSTGRQILLRRLIQPIANGMNYFHHPLLKDVSGKKLGKRDLSESIGSMRSKGMSVEELFGETLQEAGLTTSMRPRSLAEALATIDNVLMDSKWKTR